MKNILATLTIMLLVNVYALGDIIYAVREYVPRGRNYSLRTYQPIYTHLPENGSNEVVWIFYTKNNDKLFLTALMASKSLETKLPLIVLRYVGTYITSQNMSQGKSLNEVVRVTKRAIENATNAKWKNNLTTNSQIMVNNPRYQRGNSIIDNNSYYEFTPHHLLSADTTQLVYISRPETMLGGFQIGDLKRNLDAIITSINDHPEHSGSRIVSDWPWRYNKSLKTWEVLSNGPDMHSKNTDTCKLKMDLKSVNKGELLPSMCWRQINGASWTKPPTYCNFFAQALASRIFEQGGYDPQSSPGTDTGWYPWGNESTANSIHDYMISHPELFVDLKWQDCWNYINEGYIVYFVWNNPIGAGHIATGFISEPSTMTLGEKEVQVGKIVQAGTEGMTKIFTLEPGSPWGKEISDVRTFIYLGYLKF